MGRGEGCEKGRQEEEGGREGLWCEEQGAWLTRRTGVVIVGRLVHDEAVRGPLLAQAACRLVISRMVRGGQSVSQ